MILYLYHKSFYKLVSNKKLLLSFDSFRIKIMQICFNNFFRWISYIFLFLLLGHSICVGIFSNLQIPPDYGSAFIFDMFFFEFEKNLTALFSSVLFLIVAACFQQISTVELHTKRYWKGLSYLCIFFACDEWFSIHEVTLSLHGLGLFNLPIWVMTYISIGVIVAIFLIPFLKKIPKQLFFHMVAAGLVFITGAAIVETITYSDYSPTNFFTTRYQIGILFQDGLEITGLIMMIYGAFKFLSSEGYSHLSLPKKATYWIALFYALDLSVTYYLAFNSII